MRKRRVAALVGGLGVLALLSGALLYYAKLETQLKTDDVDAILGDRPTPTATRAAPEKDSFQGRDLNILLLGVDTREGENSFAGGQVDGVRSDTTMLVHISADRKRVDVVSVPRDSLVDIPACTLPDGTQSAPEKRAMFNSAFNIGAGKGGDLATAAACTRRTFEHNTGVLTDEHVVLDMAGVRDIINILGGVPFHLDQAMTSPKAGLNLPAGDQVLTGEEAIAFLRARTGTGNGLEEGSDLARIQRQQDFLGALFATVLDKRLLSNPVALTRVLDRASTSMRTSSGLASIRDLSALAWSLRNLKPDNLSTAMVPVEYAPDNPNRVVWTQDAGALWEKIRNDEPLSGGGAG